MLFSKKSICRTQRKTDVILSPTTQIRPIFNEYLHYPLKFAKRRARVTSEFHAQIRQN
jgi:hypothetical protein